MGLRWRKRTKGSKSWWNFSASKRRGLGASFSFKMGDITANFGSGGRRRVTMNLGHGLVWTKSRTVKPKTKPVVQRVEKKPMTTDEFVAKLDEIDKKLEPLDMNKWTGKQQLVFIIFVSVVCFVIQILMR